MKKVDVIVDLQFGSTGKGAIAGYLANRHNYDLVVSSNMPNAGHTYIDKNGTKMVHKVLPSGAASPACVAIMISPASVFSPKQLLKELDALRSAGYHKHVYIHEHATLLDDRHAEAESVLAAIGSTQQGSMEAMVEKLRRNPNHNPTIAWNIGNEFRGWMTDANISIIPHETYVRLLNLASNILVEGSQGYSLGLNAGFYPYCTSRDCTTARILSDALIPINWLRDVIAVVRTYPIRVGGTSGPGYKDQEEITWAQLGQTEERTTVTNRVRRVFTFSWRQIEEAIMMSGPTQLFLNFCNYITQPEIEAMVRRLNETCNDINHTGHVAFLGHGPKDSDIVEIRPREFDL